MSISIIQYIQSFQSPALDLFFQGVTFLGEETFILLFFTILYWSVDKRMAQFVGLSFFISLLVNTGVKEILHLPRPIGLEGIRSLRIHTATGYSFPSGHTQAVASLASSIAVYIKKRLITILSILIITLVGLSRLYLGVHWPIDVLGGVIFALSITLISYYLFKKNTYMPLIVISLLLGLIPLFWLADPSYSKAFGILIGYGYGIHIEKTYIGFETKTSFIKNILRIIIGLTGLLLIKAGIKPLFPEYHLFDALRYALMGFYGIAIMPWIIKRFSL
jgi:membrane-associated phospholipid phosphatase